MSYYRQFYDQCTKNYSSIDMQNFEENEITGEIYSFSRQKTLFNLYAFSKFDSYQDYNGRLSEQDCTNGIVPCEEYVNPSLTLLNIEARNFLYDYDSLIHIENDNIII